MIETALAACNQKKKELTKLLKDNKILFIFEESVIFYDTLGYLQVI